ncbi:MAG: 1-acyl-sn-glycerol-3-phosphate acyltransferase, partial [Acidobacteria bacterium]|nr:1-acyl-sn-glycerol-3-phosphate acyltransferase [Acidobacteriota bacterium]
TSPFIKELSVVGLPDGLGEKVACMIVPNYENDATLSREEVRKRIDEHFRDVSSTLPFYKRVKVHHFWDKDLPRTATRKVKRSEVLDTLQVLETSAKANPRVASPDEKEGDATWLINIVSAVSSRPRSEIRLDSRLIDLGFDSLMYVELATAIENAGGALKSPNTLTEVHDLRELASVVSRHAPAAARKASAETHNDTEREDEIHIPSFARTLGNRGLDVLQRAFYDKFLHTKYEGRVNIPVHTNFIVTSNHTSHLDMGLVKMALGDAGSEMIALAAADYFFDNKYKRAYMENFTNTVPIERSGSLRQSLRHARSFLDRGFNALIFPEGGRSMTGQITDFKPVIGYLALACRVGILPIYVYGTYEAMPKGSTLIRSRDIGTRIGRYLSIEELEDLTKGMPRSEAYRLIAALTQHCVENLRDGTRDAFDARALRKRWKDERRAARSSNVEADEQAEQVTSIGN